MLAAMNLGRDRTAVVAHRGDRTAARENTVDAFRAARVAGADGVEFDVRRTRDRHLVVLHDAARPGLGTLAEHTLAEIRAAAPWLPTLDEAIGACTGMWVNLEIKNTPADPDFDEERTAAVTVARLIGARHLHRSVLISSFDPLTTAAVRGADGRIVTGLLVSPGTPPADGVELAVGNGDGAVHLHHGDGDDAAGGMVAARAAGLPIVAWTVNDADEVRRLADAGAAAIITDRPGAAVAALQTGTSGLSGR